MKCKECDACVKHFYSNTVYVHMCTGVPEPFVIDDIEQECTEYKTTSLKIQEDIENMETYCKQNPYIKDDAIYVPTEEYAPIGRTSHYKKFMSKEIFVEAYEKWIAPTQHEPVEEAPLEADTPKWQICVDGYYPYCPICNAEPPSGHMTRHCPNCGTRLGK